MVIKLEIRTSDGNILNTERMNVDFVDEGGIRKKFVQDSDIHNYLNNKENQSPLKVRESEKDYHDDVGVYQYIQKSAIVSLRLIR